MAEAKRDGNYVPTLLGVSSADGTTPVTVYVDPVTHRALVDIAGGSGDVSGPGASTQDALVRWDNTLGTLVADSTIVLSDAGVMTPTVNDGGTLGSTSLSWADLFLASGATVNFANSNVVLTHSSGILTVSTGELRITTVGTNAASVPTLGSTSTFTNKTLTSPVINVGSDATGDIYYRNAGVFTRLPIGSATHILTVNAGGTAPEWAAAAGGGANTALSNLAAVAINASLLPGADNAIALGDATHNWSDLFLGDGAVVNFNAGDVTITHSTNTLAFAGASSGYTFATGPILPSANDGIALGSGTVSFADLFLASGGLISWANGDVTITHSAGLLTVSDPITVSGVVTGDGFAPTSTTATGNRMYLPAANTLGFAINGTGEVQLTSTALSPIADGGNSLGTTTLGWQNLFANTGFVLNIENSDWVATHTAGILTVGTGDLRVTNAGTNSASVVTVGGTQTLTSKTLTSPTINTANIGGITQLAEGASIALDAAGSADGAYSGITIAGTAGATLAFGDLVYLAAADSRWELTDADAASTSGDVIIGMCVLAAASDGSATRILLYGNIRADAAFPALTIGAPAYVGTTAGDIQTAQPSGTDDVIRRVGFALTADELLFNPSNDYVTHT